MCAVQGVTGRGGGDCGAGAAGGAVSFVSGCGSVRAGRGWKRTLRVHGCEMDCRLLCVQPFLPLVCAPVM